MIHRLPASPHAMPGRGLLSLLQRAPLFRPQFDDRLAGSLGRLGSLEVRLAAGRKDIRRAQRLRYKVFFEDGGAIPDLGCRVQRRDIDAFDAICDHLLVLDHSAKRRPGARPAVVGTYRLLRQDVAERHGGFYSGGEFDIGSLLARHPNTRFLELGRSCVAPAYRNRLTVNLLWTGVWAYAQRHRIDAMIGCASLDGTDPEVLALPLSYLHYFAAAPEAWRVRALSHRRLPMDRLPQSDIVPMEAIRRLPALLKGYLRLGARVGDGAVVDAAFGTTDVFVILPVTDIGRRYLNHFGAATRAPSACDRQG